ncbi:MAG: hypothetical protein R3B93_10275 [Bacteroidia bacterium]
MKNWRENITRQFAGDNDVNAEASFSAKKFMKFRENSSNFNSEIQKVVKKANTIHEGAYKVDNEKMNKIYGS